MNGAGHIFCCTRWLVFMNLLCAVAWPSEPETEYDHFWPQWRGPLARGVAPHGDPPLRWDEETNTRWKVALHGLSHATPVVWGNRVFVLKAVPVDGAESSQRRRRGYISGTFSTKSKFRHEIHAFNRKDGSLLWRKPLPSSPVPWGLAVDRDGRPIVTLEDGQVMCFGRSG